MDQIQSLGGPLLSLDASLVSASSTRPPQPNGVDLNIGRLKPQNRRRSLNPIKINNDISHYGWEPLFWRKCVYFNFTMAEICASEHIWSLIKGQTLTIKRAKFDSDVLPS